MLKLLNSYIIQLVHCKPVTIDIDQNCEPDAVL